MNKAEEGQESATCSSSGDEPDEVDSATRAFRNFLHARRICNSFAASANGDLDRNRAAQRAYEQAAIAMRYAPIDSPRGARAALSYLLIELAAEEPGPWCIPIFRNIMRYLRQETEAVRTSDNRAAGRRLAESQAAHLPRRFPAG